MFILLILSFLTICIITSLQLEELNNMEGFTASSNETDSEKVKRLNTEFDTNKDNLMSLIIPITSDKDTRVNFEVEKTKYTNEATKLADKLKKKYNELGINQLNIETNYTDFGHKCNGRNKKCELKDGEHKCIARLKKKHHKTGTRYNYQSCEGILNGTQDQKISLSEPINRSAEELKGILAMIHLARLNKEKNIDVIIKEYAEKKNTLNQQGYFDNNFQTMVDLRKEKQDDLKDNIDDKNIKVSNEKEIYSSFKEKNKNKESELQKYILLLKILMFIYIIILSIKILSNKLN